MLRENDLIFLLGAGCSYDANIPISSKMIDDLENMLNTNNDWRDFKRLYLCIKSSIKFSDGIVGKSIEYFDIERLVNTLTELEKKEFAIIYPFIGTWSPRLLEIAGFDFKIVSIFKEKILKNLRNWITIKNERDTKYYKNFYDFQSEYNYALRIFTLNYDLCLEKNKPTNYDLERGFDPNERIWDWRRFETMDLYSPSIYLYKLHGSIDWVRDESKGSILREVDNVPEKPDLIFGTDYKMQYIDPYLLYAYEFRKFTLDSKVIIVIGYGFRDEHINSILVQALQNNKKRKMVIISPNSKEKILPRLKELSNFSKIINQIIPISQSAKEYLENNLKINGVEELID